MEKENVKTEIIRVLNEVLMAELTAINQYFAHAELCKHWGFNALYKAIRTESIGEMKHAEWCLERIFFLGGMPGMQKLGPVRIGRDVPEMFKFDLGLEEEALGRLQEGIQICSKSDDNGTRMLLEKILKDEEEHVDFISTQIDLIKEVGLQGYLAQHIKEGGEG